MKKASIAEVKSQFGRLLKASESAPVVVTRNGKPVAVIVGIQDEHELERLLMACSPRLQAILEKSRKQIRSGDVLSHEEIWKQVAASRTRRPSQKRGTGQANGASH